MQSTDPHSKRRPTRSMVSERAKVVPYSNIRGMMKLTADATASGAIVNLAQGLPEFEAPAFLKKSARRAIAEGFNQYPNTWGHPPLREAIARKYSTSYGISFDPEEEITVTCGTSEAIAVAVLAVVNPGDEVIIFEPFYENYRPNVLAAHGVPRIVRLNPPDWTFDEKALAKAFNARTRAIVLNTPHNPTGRVFTRAELETIASLCLKWGVIAITDEIYEHYLYDGRSHICPVSIPGMEDRTITCSGLSKTFNVTGWRIGWAVAPKAVSGAIRRLHDYTTLAAAAPFQIAGVDALNVGAQYYARHRRKYQKLRDVLSGHLRQCGFQFQDPEGSYFIYADARHLGFQNDRQSASFLLEHGIAAVSGYGFYRPRARTNMLRFCFAKFPCTLEQAGEKLKKCIS